VLSQSKSCQLLPQLSSSSSSPSTAATTTTTTAAAAAAAISFLWPFPGTTWVSRHQKGRTILDFNEASDDGVAVPGSP